MLVKRTGAKKKENRTGEREREREEPLQQEQ
jgi:hypothetical protein